MGEYSYKKRRSNVRKRNIIYKAKKDNNDEKNMKMGKIKYNERMGNYEKAICLNQAFLEEYPDDNYAIIYLAKLYQKSEKYDLEKDLLIKILEERDLSKKETSFVNFLYGGLLSMEGNLDLAIEFFKEGIINSEGVELVARKDLAGIYVKRKELGKALDVLNIDGFNNQFLNNERARVFNKFDLPKKALSEIDRPILNEKNIELSEKFDNSIIEQDKHYQKGHAFFKMYRFDEALDELEKALTYKTRDVYYQAIIDLIRLFIAKGNISRASLLCDEALKSDYIKPKYTSTIKKLNASIYKKTKEYDKAVDIFKNSMSSHDLVNMAYILFNAGKIEEAEKIYESVNITSLPVDDYYEGLLKYALVLNSLGKYEKSNEIIKILLEGHNKHLKIERIMYILKRLKLLNDISLGNELEDREYTYTEKQIINYSKEEALKHIYEHHFLTDSYSCFSEGISCEGIFEFATEKIQDEIPTHEEIFDRYIIDFDGIGYSLENGEELNQLEVITIINTKKIITLYPSKFLKLRIFDEDGFTSKKQIKRLTQIDKFNARYGNKQN